MERSRQMPSPMLSRPEGHPGVNLSIRSCGRTDVGLRRLRNEDYFGLDDHEKIYLLADGMGGGPHGDLAARLAVETIHQSISRLPHDLDADVRFELAIQGARRQIVNAILENPRLIGMGTTVVGLLLCGRRAVVAHVGDSRAYRLRGNQLDLLTRDHTMAAALVKEGHLSESDAVGHRLNHVLTHALCNEDICEVELASTSVADGDIFLLCSDGLSNMLSDAEIHALLHAGGDPQEGCDRLIRAALERGGHDNVTVVLVEVLNADG